jgi:hypothetical protein
VYHRTFLPPKRIPTFREVAAEWLNDKERLEAASYE